CNIIKKKYYGLPELGFVRSNILFLFSSQLVSTAPDKAHELPDKLDNEVSQNPLNQETNNGMYLVHESVNVDKNHFGIVGVHEMHLNVLVRDKVKVHQYYHLQSAVIPVQLLT
ncbi:13171_t:CDS:2, partial [Entrophospora sp. SA101]